MPPTPLHKYPYKTPKLVKTKRNGKAYYYIDFSAYNAITGKLQRKRITKINSIENLKLREIETKKIIKHLERQLAQGHHFNERKKLAIEEQQAFNYDKKTYTIEEALVYAYKK